MFDFEIKKLDVSKKYEIERGNIKIYVTTAVRPKSRGCFRSG